MIFFSEKKGICDRIFLSQNIYDKLAKIHHQKKKKKKAKRLGDLATCI